MCQFFSLNTFVSQFDKFRFIGCKYTIFFPFIILVKIMLFGNQWESREQLKRRGCLINEFASDKGLRLRVVQYLAKSLHQEFRAGLTHMLCTPSSIFAYALPCPFHDNLFIYLCMVLQEEPYIIYITWREAFTHSTKLMSEHIRHSHHSNIRTCQ